MRKTRAANRIRTPRDLRRATVPANYREGEARGKLFVSGNRARPFFASSKRVIYRPFPSFMRGRGFILNRAYRGAGTRKLLPALFIHLGFLLLLAAFRRSLDRG